MPFYSVFIGSCSIHYIQENSIKYMGHKPAGNHVPAVFSRNVEIDRLLLKASTEVIAYE